MLIGFDLHPQNPAIADSLKLIIENPQRLGDSLKLQIYLDLAFHEPNPVSGVNFSDTALELALKNGDPLSIAEAYEVVASTRRLIGDKIKAFESAFNALEIIDSLGLAKRQAALLLQIGTQYTADENYQEGTKYLKQSLQLIRALGERRLENLTAINLGETYRLMGQLDSALYYNELVLNSEAGQADEVIKAYTEGNTGMVLNAQGQLSRAKPLLVRSIKALTEMGDLYSASVYQADLGDLQIKQGERINGIQQIKEALAIAKAENLKEQIRDFSQKLGDYYAAAGDFTRAYPYQVQYAAYRDSLVNADNIRKIAETRYGYELDKKEQEVENLSLSNQLSEANLEQAQTRLLLFIVLAVLLLALAVVLYLSYRRKRNDNALLTERNTIIQTQSEQKELLHRELHHRVKNNLQLIGSIMSLQSSSTTEEAVARAMKEGRSRVDALLLIHQNLYRQEKVTHVNFHDYLSKLCQNFELSYSQEVNSIHFSTPKIEVKTDDIIPLGLVINEVVANAVKHRGEKSIDLNIELKAQYELYELSIADNGPGGFVLSTNGKGFGTQLIQTLAQQLRAEVTASSSDEGTSICLKLPQNIAARLNPVA